MARIGRPPMPGPDTRIVELRVSWGARAEDVLDAVSAVQVAGDGVHRLMRPADRLRRPAPGAVLPAGGRSTPRVTEAYLPPVRPGWLPFALLEPARWAAGGGWPARWLRAADVVLRMLLVCVPGVLIGATWFPQAAAALPAALLAVAMAVTGRDRVLRLVAGLATAAALAVFGPVVMPVPAAVFAVLVLGCAVLVPRRGRDVPSAVRPLLGGWLAVPLLALAGFLATGLIAAAASLLAVLDPGAALPAGYRALGVAWLVGVLVAALVTAVLAVLGARRTDGALLALLHPGDDRRVARAAWRRAAAARAGVWTPVALLAGLLAGLAVAPVAGVPGWLGQAGCGLPVLLLGCAVARGPVGGLPAVLRGADAAVDVLAARARELLAEEQTRVVLAGHGHGGLLAVLTALRLVRTLPDAQRARLGLLTVGTPVRWLYLRTLRVLDAAALSELSRELGGRWRALCRGSDPYGGAVTAWRWQVSGDGELLGSGLVPGGGPGELTSSSGEHGVRVLGADHWLPDPAPGPVLGRRWAPGVRGHRDYACTPEWDAAVAVAAGLSTSDFEQPTLFRLPENWRSRRPADRSA